MRTSAVLFLVCMLIASGAWAQKTAGDDTADLPPRTDCNTEGYDEYAGGTGDVIPDDDPDGLTFGPVSTAPGGAIRDVILKVNMSSTWVGDVRLWLLYDVEPDGTPDTAVVLLCRHQLADCPPDGCCGCSGDLLGWYGFDDTAESIEVQCPSEFPPGCYGPDYDSSGLGAFYDAPTGGDFYLFCADGAAGDVTEVFEWNVYVLSELTPVEDSSWGSVKALYR